VRFVAQILGLIEVTIREWVRPVYNSYADSFAQMAVLVSIGLIVLAAFFAFAKSAVHAFVDLRPRALVYLIGGVVFSGIGIVLFGSGRADQFAAEARNRWPWLSSNAKVLSVGFCLFSILLVVGAIFWAVHIGKG
jgi:hypothetical protein